jgi:hypothetical protein
MHDVDEKCVLCTKLRMMAQITDGFFSIERVSGDDDTVSSLGDYNNDQFSLKEFHMRNEGLQLDADDYSTLGSNLGTLGEDEGLVERTEETNIESNFCSSVRTDTPHNNGRQFNGPSYRERMVGLSGMIQNWCGVDLSALTTIAHISNWKMFKTGFFPLSVRVRMKDLGSITIAHFVDCYERMETLYDEEKVKEGSKKKILEFHDYCEELIEFWALMDMTLTLLVSEEGSGLVSAMDLLQVATTRVHFATVIERVVLHHFQDVDPGGGLRALITQRVSVEGNRVLVDYRKIVKESGKADLKEYPLNSELASDNVHYSLLLQLLSVQKQYNDASKSSKRKLGERSVENSNLDEQDTSDDVFLQTVQSFSDHLLAFLHDQPTDDDMMRFIESEIELVTYSYRKNKRVRV